MNSLKNSLLQRKIRDQVRILTLLVGDLLINTSKTVKKLLLIHSARVDKLTRALLWPLAFVLSLIISSATDPISRKLKGSGRYFAR